MGKSNRIRYTRDDFQESKFEMSSTRRIPVLKGTVCSLCNNRKSNLVRRHKIPASLGGIYYGCNLSWVCKPCGQERDVKLPNVDEIKEIHKSTLKALEQLSVAMEEHFQESKEKILLEIKQNNVVLDLDLYKEIINNLKISSAKSFKHRFEVFSNFAKLLRTMI